MIIQLHRQANERPRTLEPAANKAHNRTRSKGSPKRAPEALSPANPGEKRMITVKRTGSLLQVNPDDSGDENAAELDLLSESSFREYFDGLLTRLSASGYSFFDSGDVKVLNPQRRRPTVGKLQSWPLY